MYSAMKLGGHNKDLMSKLISEFSFVRENVDVYNKSKKSKVVLSSDTKNNALVDFLRNFGRTPTAKERHVYNEYTVNVGCMYSIMKLSGSHKSLMSKLISEFTFVKENVDAYNKSKENKIVKKRCIG